MRSASSASASTRCRTRSRELGRLGLLERLDAAAIRTYELFYLNRFGQEIWREPRGLDAGYEVPQFSIHRGRLQGVIRDAVIERLGADAVRTGCRLGAFRQDEGGVTAWFFDRLGSHVATTRGDVLVGADGIHSSVRAALVPGEGPPALERPHAVARRDRVAGVPDRPLDDRRRRPLGQDGGLSDRRGLPARPQADELGGRGARRRGRRAAAEGGLVAARPARGADAACRALRDPACRRRGADRARRRSSGNIRCATAIRCRAGRTAA